MTELTYQEWFGLYSQWVDGELSNKEVLELIPGASIKASSPHIYFPTLPVSIFKKTFPGFTPWESTCPLCGGELHIVLATKNKINELVLDSEVQEGGSKVGFLELILKRQDMLWTTKFKTQPRVYCIDCQYGPFINSEPADQSEDRSQDMDSENFEQEVLELYGNPVFTKYENLSLPKKYIY